MTRGWLLAAGALACASGGPVPPAAAPATAAPASAPSRASPAPATLEAMLAEDIAAERGMPWSGRRPLVWTDFRGRPPQTGSEGARTAYGIYYAWSCRGRAFAFHAVAAFHPLRSWVKPIVVGHPTEGARVLRHEQVHFDLSEVFARRMRERFAALSAACARSDVALRALAQQVLQDEKQTQQRYDAETNHGLIADRQAAWHAEVARMLRAAERSAP